mgnify:CR=1 FL=1|tara:strand:+ start:21207 stop:21344 length:138 start_codon:yes stop_codon:yes gene_type:complete
MVAVGTMQDNVGGSSFLGDEIGTVEVTIDEANFRVLSCNLGTPVR